jgi:hypothetical protein
MKHWPKNVGQSRRSKKTPQDLGQGRIRARWTNQTLGYMEAPTKITVLHPKKGQGPCRLAHSCPGEVLAMGWQPCLLPILVSSTQGELESWSLVAHTYNPD